MQAFQHFILSAQIAVLRQSDLQTTKLLSFINCVGRISLSRWLYFAASWRDSSKLRRPLIRRDVIMALKKGWCCSGLLIIILNQKFMTQEQIPTRNIMFFILYKCPFSVSKFSKYNFSKIVHYKSWRTKYIIGIIIKFMVPFQWLLQKSIFLTKSLHLLLILRQCVVFSKL